MLAEALRATDEPRVFDRTSAEAKNVTVVAMSAMDGSFSSYSERRFSPQRPRSTNAMDLKIRSTAQIPAKNALKGREATAVSGISPNANVSVLRRRPRAGDAWNRIKREPLRRWQGLRRRREIRLGHPVGQPGFPMYGGDEMAIDLAVCLPGPVRTCLPGRIHSAGPRRLRHENDHPRGGHVRGSISRDSSEQSTLAEGVHTYDSVDWSAKFNHMECDKDQHSSHRYGTLVSCRWLNDSASAET